MDILNKEAWEQKALIKAGALSVSELMQETLARIELVNPKVNALVNILNKEACEKLTSADCPLGGALGGVPMAIKDLANVKGFKTTEGSPLYSERVARKDDQMVARLRAAGALFIGKTNTPEFGLGSNTFNPVYGKTKNPYDLTRTCGGSSGGAAVALATRMLSISDGSDMMGSLRNPAAWNNVYGMRPTWGLVPPEPSGEIFLSQLSTLGPMARSPKDLALLLDVQANHFDNKSDVSQSKSFSNFTAQPRMKGIKIGWLGDWGGTLTFEDGLLDLAQKALNEMSSLGAIIHDLKAPFAMNDIWASWCDLRAWQITNGLRDIYEDIEKREYLKPEAVWEIENGFSLSGQDIYDAALKKSKWYNSASELFEKFDLLVLPSTQVWPFDLAEIYPVSIKN
ncbi:MAG: amidase, partial [Rhodobacteraceae bacterium]|nr:amidase [Paracoccaceae bacterium]